MQHFRPSLSLYLLPVYFFTLGVSPNISGDRIGVILAVVYLGLIPLANFWAFLANNSLSPTKKDNNWLTLLLAIFLFLGSILLSWQISWQLCLIALLFVLIYVVLKSQFASRSQFNRLFPFLIGVLLFSTIYLGLNQYGFGQLFSLKNILVATLCGFLVSPILYLEGAGGNTKIAHVVLLLVTEIIFFGIYFSIYYSWYYAGIFVLALIPVGVMMNTERNSQIEEVGSRRRVFIKLSYSFVLIGFFIYFFLDSTQVLQAIRGGY